MRILQAPSNIANQAWLNAEALRARGHEVEVWQFGASRFGYRADRVFEDVSKPSTIVNLLVEAIALKPDVVHFHYARSLVPAVGGLPWLWDLPVWKALGVKVVVSFHGSEIRIPRIAKELDPWSAFHFADLPVDESTIDDALAVIRAYADGTTVSNVANLPYAPQATYLPLSVDLRGIAEEPLSSATRSRPVVAHAPSARGLKGTKFVLEAFERLRDEGVEFDVDLIEGVTNSEVLERYGRADVVVEKLVNEGFGVAALEALAVGRPVISRIASVVREAHPDLPIVDATPETFSDVLRGLLSDDAERRRLGAAGRPYVAANHDIALTGPRLEEIYRGKTVPAPVVFPGWTVPHRDRVVGQLRAQLDELRLATSMRGSEVERAARVLERENGRLAARNAELERKVATSVARTRTLEREVVELRHGFVYRLRRRLRKMRQRLGL